MATKFFGKFIPMKSRLTIKDKTYTEKIFDRAILNTSPVFFLFRLFVKIISKQIDIAQFSLKERVVF